MLSRKIFFVVLDSKICLNFQKSLQASTLTDIKNTDEFFSKKNEFASRHIGPRESDQQQMLELLGFKVIFKRN